MKTLFLHVDYIRFKPLKKALKKIDDLSEKEKRGSEVKDALAILTAVEKSDSNINGIVDEFIKNIKKIAEKINVKKIVLYPYAHLSSNLASPEIAINVLKETEERLKKEFEVVKAPFGYYKEFELKVKGHPLAELSREIKVDNSKENSKNGKIGEEVDIKNLLKKMGKVKMSTKKPPKNLKSNIELGRDLDLYIISEIVGHGLPLFTPKGTAIIRELRKFIEDEEIKRGYLYTSTPIMAKSDLYKISGHWQHYKDDMFVMNVRGETFALRPMTCPFQFILYKRKPRSYKDLPLKYAEIAALFRNEKSGELRGLSRVRQFHLADAHIICRPDQIEEEFIGALELVKFVMKKLGIKDIWYRFSKGDIMNKKKYVNDSKAWKESEALMEKILKKLKLNYITAKDEAAFYGPKLDLQYKDVYGKEDTLFTIQIDFALPERYDMIYKDKDNKEKRPMVIHRSSIGAIERILAVLLEQNQGNLKTWLSPVQVRVLSFTDRNTKAAEEVVEKIKEAIPSIRIDIDFESNTMGSKVKRAELMKIPYIATIGDNEEKDGTITLKIKGDRKLVTEKVGDFISKLKEEIEERA